jgi:hypothetical protein
LALKASCAFCKKTFSAPEEYRGKKVDCPSCGRRFVLLTEEEAHQASAAAAAEVEDSRRKREEDRQKIALLERLESRARKRSGKPYYEEFQTGSAGVRHFSPTAPSRFLRFRALSDVIVLGAYLELLLVAVGAGIMVYLRYSGIIETASVLFALLVAWLVVGIGLYLFFKYLGELAFLLADVGDQQNDLVQLLLDLRDNTDREDTLDGGPGS